MLPDHLNLIRTLSGPTVRPDGSDVVFCVTRPDTTHNRYHSALWRLATSGRGSRTPVQLTHGGRDRAPAYSPDGSRIAFLRAGEDAPPQLHLLGADGGDAVRLTDAPLGIGGFAWSPDGRRIAYTARVPEAGRYGTDELIKPDQEAPRLIAHSKYLSDGLGYLLDRPQHVFLIDLDDLPADSCGPDAPELPTSVQLTAGGGDDSSPVFLDGGTRVGFVAARDGRGRWRPDSLASDLCSVDLRGKGFRRHTGGAGPVGSVGSVVTSADGTQAYYSTSDLGPSGQDFVARNQVWYRLAGDATSAAAARTPLTDAEADHPSGAAAVTTAGLVIGLDTRGDTVLRDVTSGTLLLGGPRTHVSVGEVATGGGVVAAVAGSPTSFGELYVGAVGETLRKRTDFAAELTAVAPPLAREELTATSTDGYPVHGWVVLPERATTAAPVPVLLMIHGGPYAQHTGNLFDEAQVMAGAGYAVLLCNPRGSAGYGAAHGRAVKDAIGTVDVADILAFLDHALTDPRLDGERVGILGGSYGGLMTTWITSHTDRFTAAVSERAVNTWDSFAGTSDIGWFFGDEYSGAFQHEQSPLSHADRIRTPMLIVHSERDFRCPLEQAQRLFALLRRNEVPSRLLIFPGEGHELSRSGQPRHRLQRFEHILDWWGEHLPTS